VETGARREKEREDLKSAGGLHRLACVREKKRHDGERTAQTEGEGVIAGLFHRWRG